MLTVHDQFRGLYPNAMRLQQLCKPGDWLRDLHILRGLRWRSGEQSTQGYL